MSALDKLRSFAESREPDGVLVRNGLTYGDVRAALAALGVDRVATLEKALREATLAVTWMSGAADFSVHSKAHGGWVKVRDDLYRWLAVLTPSALSFAPTAKGDDDSTALARLRSLLGLVPQATVGQIAYHVECVVADRDELHAEKVRAYLARIEADGAAPGGNGAVDLAAPTGGRAGVVPARCSVCGASPRTHACDEEACEPTDATRQGGRGT